MGGIDQTNRHQAVNRLDRIDGVATGHRNPCRPTDRSAAFKHFADGVQWQHINRHANQRQRKERRAAHGVNVGNGVGRGDPAKIVGIIDDGHEEIGRRDNRLLRVDLIHRGVVAGFRSHQQLWRHDARRHAGEDFLQDGRCNFAATTAAMGKLGKSDFFW